MLGKCFHFTQQWDCSDQRPFLEVEFFSVCLFCFFFWGGGGGGGPPWGSWCAAATVGGLKFWSILGTRGHWILSILRNARICCRSFGSGRAVTSCFNDLGLSRPGIEPHAACETNTLPTTTAVVTWSQNVDIRIDALIVYICN